MPDTVPIGLRPTLARTVSGVWCVVSASASVPRPSRAAYGLGAVCLRFGVHMHADRPTAYACAYGVRCVVCGIGLGLGAEAITRGLRPRCGVSALRCPHACRSAYGLRLRASKNRTPYQPTVSGSAYGLGVCLSVFGAGSVRSDRIKPIGNIVACVARFTVRLEPHQSATDAIGNVAGFAPR